VQHHDLGHGGHALNLLEATAARRPPPAAEPLSVISRETHAQTGQTGRQRGRFA
jgi:hypothetical protein